MPKTQTLTPLNAGEGQKNKNSLIADGNYSHFGRQLGNFLNIHLQCLQQLCSSELKTNVVTQNLRRDVYGSFFFFPSLSTPGACGTSPTRGSNPWPLQWKGGILATGPRGKSGHFILDYPKLETTKISFNRRMKKLTEAYACNRLHCSGMRIKMSSQGTVRASGRREGRRDEQGAQGISGQWDCSMWCYVGRYMSSYMHQNPYNVQHREPNLNEMDLVNNNMSVLVHQLLPVFPLNARMLIEKLWGNVGRRLGGVGMWRLSVFSVQFPCKPKIALKEIKVYF